MNDSAYLRDLAGLEFQIIVLDSLALLQWHTLGSHAEHKASQSFHKSLWKKKSKKLFTLFDKLRPQKAATPKPDDAQAYQDWLFAYLQEDWNKVYEEIGKSGTLMAYLSGYLSGNLKLPEQRVEQMSIADYELALRYKKDIGLDDLEKDKERLYALAYARREGAKWIAIYENGERKGRPYEIITKLFQKQVAQAIEAGETLEQAQSRMAFPDLLALLEEGEITEEQYLEWSEQYLNRDFRRFALTESAYAWQHGKLAEMADRAKASSQPQYLDFVTGAGGRVL